MTTPPAGLFLAPEPLEGEVLPPLAAGGEVTEECDQPGCGWSVTGPAGGKGSAPMLLGRHRWSVHKIRKDGTVSAPKGKGKTAPDPVALATDPHPFAATVAAVGGQVTGTGAPRAEQLANALGLGVSVVSGGVARWAVRTDPDPAMAESPERQEAVAAALSLDQAAAAKILTPVARLLAPTALNRKYGRAVVEHTDVGPAVMELVDLASVWGQYLAVRRATLAELRAQRAAQAGPVAVPTGPATAAPPPPVPTAPPASVVGDPFLGGGRIATARH